MFSCMLSSVCGLLCIIAGYYQPSVWYFTCPTTSENRLPSSQMVIGFNSQVTGELFRNQANFFAFKWEIYRRSPGFELVVLSPMRLCRKQVSARLMLRLGHYNSFVSAKERLSLIPVLHVKCQCQNKVKLGQGCHCQLIVQKKKLLPYVSLLSPLFTTHLRKGTLSCDLVIFAWERPTSDQSLKALTVPQLCSVALNLCPTSVAGLLQLWATPCPFRCCYPSLAFLRLSLPGGSYVFRPGVWMSVQNACISWWVRQKTDRRCITMWGKVYPGVGCHTDLSSHGQMTDIWDILILILLLVCWIDLRPTILTLCLCI